MRVFCFNFCLRATSLSEVLKCSPTSVTRHLRAARGKVNPILESLVTEVLLERPDNPEAQLQSLSADS